MAARLVFMPPCKLLHGVSCDVKALKMFFRDSECSRPFSVFGRLRVFLFLFFCHCRLSFSFPSTFLASPFTRLFFFLSVLPPPPNSMFASSLISLFLYLPICPDASVSVYCFRPRCVSTSFFTCRSLSYCFLFYPLFSLLSLTSTN